MHLDSPYGDVRMYIVTFSGKRKVIYRHVRNCWMSSPNDSSEVFEDRSKEKRNQERIIF